MLSLKSFYGFAKMPLKHPWLKPHLVMIQAAAASILKLTFIIGVFLAFSQNITKLFFNNSSNLH